MVGFGAFWSLTAPNHHSLSYWKWLGSNKQQNHLLWCPTDRFNWYRAVKLQNDKTHHKITKVIQMKPSKFCVMTDQNVSHISSLSLCKPNLIRFLIFYFYFFNQIFSMNNQLIWFTKPVWMTESQISLISSRFHWLSDTNISWRSAVILHQTHFTTSEKSSFILKSETRIFLKYSPFVFTVFCYPLVLNNMNASK